MTNDSTVVYRVRIGGYKCLYRSKVLISVYILKWILRVFISVFFFFFYLQNVLFLASFYYLLNSITKLSSKCKQNKNDFIYLFLFYKFIYFYSFLELRNDESGNSSLISAIGRHSLLVPDYVALSVSISLVF